MTHPALLPDCPCPLRPGQCKERVPERAFWSAVTTNAPLYGADTPTSFFDGALPWGWNLRDLQARRLQTHAASRTCSCVL